MTESKNAAPERIWARFATTGPGVNIRKWSTADFAEAEAEYIRADIVKAMVAAAEYPAHMVAVIAAAAAQTAVNACDDYYYHEDIKQAVLSLTPADARAALEAIIAKAVAAETERVVARVLDVLGYCDDVLSDSDRAAIREGKK